MENWWREIGQHKVNSLITERLKPSCYDYMVLKDNIKSEVHREIIKFIRQESNTIIKPHVIEYLPIFLNNHIFFQNALEKQKKYFKDIDESHMMKLHCRSKKMINEMITDIMDQQKMTTKMIEHIDKSNIKRFKNVENYIDYSNNHIKNFCLLTNVCTIAISVGISFIIHHNS